MLIEKQFLVFDLGIELERAQGRELVLGQELVRVEVLKLDLQAELVLLFWEHQENLALLLEKLQVEWAGC